MTNNQKFRYWVVAYPDSKKIIGGVKQLHRLVETIQGLDRSATLIQTNSDFHPGWFDSKAPRISLSEWRTLDGLSPSRDIVILPETNPSILLKYAPGLPKVIFNQNGHYTFLGNRSRELLDISDVKAIYKDPSILHTLCVSSYDHNLLVEGLGINDEMVTILPNPLETDIFSYAGNAKRRQIAYMPRKNSQDAFVVAGLLKQQPWLKAWEIISIDQQPQLSVASILRESLLFLSFGHPEGFGLPVAEAMACGCFCIGYSGLGGRELYSLAELTSSAISVEPADWMGFLKAVREAITVYRIDPGTMLSKLKKNSETICLNYNITAFRATLKSTLSRIEKLALTS